MAAPATGFGGPNFLGAGPGETNIVAGTTITGDFMCRAANLDYRMDTALGAGIPRAVRHAVLARISGLRDRIATMPRGLVARQHGLPWRRTMLGQDALPR